MVVTLLIGCSTSRNQTAKSDVSIVTPVIQEPQHPVKKKNSDKRNNGWWGKAFNEEQPWVSSPSRTNSITKGLEGRHISLWASHGRYYKKDTNKWAWQRPLLFGTNEDLFTQSFVIPYIIPMLQNAGAVVFTPRERDWQNNEVVIDNDSPRTFICDGKEIIVSDTPSKTAYTEIGKWKTIKETGFSIPKDGLMRDGEMPFTTGTARYCSSTKGSASHFVEYTPEIPEEGDYAVYVSYQTIEGSIDDAHYTVFHSNMATEFRVNQRMGGGTWVYLGTFHFNKRSDALNCVVLDNNSKHNGKVTTDAVRFGGGMGNTLRGDSILTTSGLPRFDEGARYYCQWAGAPYSIYSQRGGTDDYADDINSRSMMTNWLAGGSCFEPDTVGLRVPIELCLAIHSDAGFNSDFKSIYGSLGICTTDFNNGKLAAGHPRSHSRELVDTLLNNVSHDLKRIYGKWNVRDIYDRNYSETRRPEMPSAILEMLSHQSFPDMKLAHDPNFKFSISRAIYKAVLKYIAHAHGKTYIVQPLPPANLSSSLSESGNLSLSWTAQNDSLEPTAKANSFKVYIAKGDDDFDNGNIVKSNNISINLQPATLYRFRVSAINEGGESLKSEEMAAIFRPGKPMVLVANGFHRLAAPQVIDSISGSSTKHLGFDITSDPGLSFGKTPVWAGKQIVYDASKSKGEGPGTFGYSNTELAGTLVAGNDFNYTTTHVKAIASSFGYSAVSCSATTLPFYDLSKYAAIDLIIGNERNDGYSTIISKALPQYLRDVIDSYNGGLFISGSYVASDASNDVETAFLNNSLHLNSAGQYRLLQPEIHGMGMTFEIHKTINPQHYASVSSDILSPTNGAFATLAYADGSTAAVAFDGRKFIMGFPFECIKTEKDRNSIMTAILKYITPASK